MRYTRTTRNYRDWTDKTKEFKGCANLALVLVVDLRHAELFHEERQTLARLVTRRQVHRRLTLVVLLVPVGAFGKQQFQAAEVSLK